MSRDAWASRQPVGTKVAIRDMINQTLERYYATDYATVTDAYRDGGLTRQGMEERGETLVSIERVYSAD
tara:strand:+ start:3110 stop:3316 length:207 start_codon:yes stop_codon:yes gene_type:complete